MDKERILHLPFILGGGENLDSSLEMLFLN